jgi:hypothetical protein
LSGSFQKWSRQGYSGRWIRPQKEPERGSGIIVLEEQPEL